MALALSDSIGKAGWSLNDQTRRYVQWWREGKYSVNNTGLEIMQLAWSWISPPELQMPDGKKSPNESTGH